MLKISGLKVAAQEKEILHGIDLEVRPGEVVGLMGPNGSGKSTLANCLMGQPGYTVTGGEIILDGESLLDQSVDARARAGLFLAFQYPVGISGVTVREMLLTAMRARNEKTVSALDLKRMIEMEAESLGIKDELLKRGLNEGFSGGEKKKMEILQMRILKPKYAILDETDSGLDVDALKTVAQSAMAIAREQGIGILVVTHYQKILEYLKPDRMIIMKAGQVVEEGGADLAIRIEKEGYEGYE